MACNRSANNKESDSIAIGGFVPLTTIDFPEHLSAVVFCQGCPLACYYCHNPDLIAIKQIATVKYNWLQIQNFLKRRVNLLEAVVFSGGEPTLQLGLIKAVRVTKDLGFKVGLHTAGIYPDRLRNLLPYLDWVGMDIKAPFDDYYAITKIANIGKQALKSVQIILDSGVSYEFRTTVHPKLLNKQQISSIILTLKSLGVDNYKLQPFRSYGCLDPELNLYTFDHDLWSEYIALDDFIKTNYSLSCSDEQSII